MLLPRMLILWKYEIHRAFYVISLFRFHTHVHTYTHTHQISHRNHGYAPIIRSIWQVEFCSFLRSFPSHPLPFFRPFSLKVNRQIVKGISLAYRSRKACIIRRLCEEDPALCWFAWSKPFPATVRSEDLRSRARSMISEMTTW